MTTASIIILTWQGMPYIAACLEAVFAQSYAAFEVIVVDNASTDGTPDLVAAHYPQARLIRNTRNAGFAAGCNVGIRAATGDVIVLLNQDTVVERDWLTALMQAMQQPGVGIVGCKCLYPDGRIQHAGGYLERPSSYPHHYGTGETDHGQFDEPRDVEFVTGAALAITRSALAAIGELDEDLGPAYFEDIDWCFHARAAGFAVRYEPTARLVHHDGGSGRGKAQVMAFHRARVAFMLKHWPCVELLQFTADENQQRQPIASEVEAVARARAYLANASCLHRIRARRAAIYGDQSSMRVSDTEWDLVVENLLAAREGALRWALLRQMPALPVTPTSDTSVNGKLSSVIRSAWYSLAARWAMRHLSVQQLEYNRQVQRILSLLIEDENMLADQLRRMPALPVSVGMSTSHPNPLLQGEREQSAPDLTSNTDWLGVKDSALDAQQIMRQVEERRVAHKSVDDPTVVARELWDDLIAPAAAQMRLTPTLSENTDIYPASYAIQHRNPILGPINSVLRHFINTEVRRYLDPALRQQSRLNQQTRESVVSLMQDYNRLQRELDELRSRTQPED